MKLDTLIQIRARTTREVRTGFFSTITERASTADGDVIADDMKADREYEIHYRLLSAVAISWTMGSFLENAYTIMCENLPDLTLNGDRISVRFDPKLESEFPIVTRRCFASHSRLNEGINTFSWSRNCLLTFKDAQQMQEYLVRVIMRDSNTVVPKAQTVFRPAENKGCDATPLVVAGLVALAIL